MAFATKVHAQDLANGRVGEVLAAVTETAAGAGPFSHVEGAVAYASRAGVELLISKLSENPRWQHASKRFLISIDRGVTEPSALTTLASLPNTHVRIPNGRTVIASKTLSPPTTFHAKGYLFRTEPWSAPSGLVVGSANMTVSALAVGSEVVSAQVWSGNLTSSSKQHLKDSANFLEWFEDAWAIADPLDQVLADYKASYKRYPRPRAPEEDRTPASKAYVAPDDQTVVNGPLVVQLAGAQTLWVETAQLYRNLRGGTIGNQLDTPRGTRVFFGFPAARVSVNHLFGYIELQAVGFAPVQRSVRFGDNSMDKINLPIPGTDGPSTYEHSFLIFDRAGKGASGLPLFRLSASDRSGLDGRIAAATNSTEISMGGGRHFGLLF